MTTVVAVADAVRTLDCAETHGEHKIQLSNSQLFGDLILQKSSGSPEDDLLISGRSVVVFVLPDF